MRSRAFTAVEEGVGMPDHPGKDLTLGALPCGAAKLLSESGPDPSEEKETTEREDPVRRSSTAPEQWFSNLKFAKALLPSLLENTDSKAVTGRFGAEGVGWGLEKSFQEHTPGDSSTDVSGPTNGGYFLGKLDNTLLRRERIPLHPAPRFSPVSSREAGRRGWSWAGRGKAIPASQLFLTQPARRRSRQEQGQKTGSLSLLKGVLA